MTSPFLKKKIFKTKSRTKYRNKKTVFDGIKFPSKGQAYRYAQLKQQEKLGLIKNLKLEVPFKFIVNGKLICTYRADYVYDERGQQIVEDYKSEITKTPLYLVKKKLMEAIYNISIRETFYEKKQSKINRS